MNEKTRCRVSIHLHNQNMSQVWVFAKFTRNSCDLNTKEKFLCFLNVRISYLNVYANEKSLFTALSQKMLLSNFAKTPEKNATSCKMPMNGTGLCLSVTMMMMMIAIFALFYNYATTLNQDIIAISVVIKFMTICSRWYAFFRLSPLYLMVGLLTEIFTSYIADVSKFWIHDRTDLNCQRYVWARESLSSSWPILYGNFCVSFLALLS